MKLLLCIITLISTAAYGAWRSEYSVLRHNGLSPWGEPIEPKMGIAPSAYPAFRDRGKQPTLTAQPTELKLDGDAPLQESTPKEPIVLQAAICTTVNHKPEATVPLE